MPGVPGVPSGPVGPGSWKGVRGWVGELMGRLSLLSTPLKYSFIQLTGRPRGARLGAVDSAGRAWAGRWMVMSVREKQTVGGLLFFC